MCSLHLTHPSAQTLGVRCLAQESHLSRGQILLEPRFEPTTSGYMSDTLSIRATTAPKAIISFTFRICSRDMITSHPAGTPELHAGTDSEKRGTNWEGTKQRRARSKEPATPPPLSFLVWSHQEGQCLALPLAAEGAGQSTRCTGERKVCMCAQTSLTALCC